MIFIHKRNDVRHRTQRHEIEVLFEIGKFTFKTFVAKTTPYGRGQFKSDAHATQSLEGIGATRLARINNGNGVWKHLGRAMMVGDDKMDTVFPCLTRNINRRDAGVHSHYGLAPGLPKRHQPREMKAVPLLHPARNKVRGGNSERSKKKDQKRGRGNSVSIIVAVNTYRAAFHDLSGQVGGGLFHPLH